ncbi:MAG: serine/threonine protein kinase [Scytonematopsis contorta HA4267-MV1]|jgi:serine/threonine-protein kinase|nr:serine/threonine protein kinase [Scytonematopsis contorta HA4267-MV1]
MIPKIEIGTLINSRYRIKKLLGKGEFGGTYLALDNQRFDEPCVLKEFVTINSKEENLCISKKLFERKAKVLYQIQHPQVPQFLAWFTDDERIFMIQQYINGKTYSEILSDHIASKGQPFSETEVKTWLMDTLPVLEYLHEHKVIHRDISLDNIILPYEQSKPVLINFGAVKENFAQIMSSDSLNSFNSIRYSVNGRLGYSPPELLRLGLSYPSSDFYTLGVCAVILLTGKMPHLLLDELLNWQWRSQVNICDNFAKILHKMLAQEPSLRFHSAQEIIFALNNIHNNSFVLPAFKFSIKSPIEAIKNHYNEKENQKALEELLILKKLEKEIRQFDDTDESNSPSQSIYLNLDLSEYIKQKSENSIDNDTGSLINIPAIKSKINNFFTKRTDKNTEKINPYKSKNSNNISISNINADDFLESTYTNNLQLLEIIIQEFSNFVGPISKVIINENLAFLPGYSLKQFIEILAAEIPDKLTAETFTKHIYNMFKIKLSLQE